MSSPNVIKDSESVGGTLVGASILAADFANLSAECRRVLDGGADLLHLDVMDGHFVPNLTMGPALCSSLREAFPDVCLDAHLMVTDPEQYVKPFADAGASHLTFHVEAHNHPESLAEKIHVAGMTSGIAINPPTQIEKVLPHIEAFDLILVMSVNPGFAGQSFIPHVLEKARLIHEKLRPGQRLQIDGGVNSKNASQCREAGCDILVAASAIFSADDYADAIRELRGSESKAHNQSRAETAWR